MATPSSNGVKDATTEEDDSWLYGGNAYTLHVKNIF